MFKIVFLLLTLVALSTCSLIHKNTEKYRLIQFTDGRKLWLSIDTVKELQKLKPGKLLNFMDITFTEKFEGKIPKSDPLPEKPTQQNIVKPLLEKVDKNSEEKLRKTIEHLQKYPTRSALTSTGQQAAYWIRDQYINVISKLPVDRQRLFSVQLYNHTLWKQPSVIVTMNGKTKKTVILGGHMDSTAGFFSDAPGADDDATGSGSVLEAFRIIAKSDYVPTKTIEFHGYAAEELGLLGSLALARYYRSNNRDIYGMMQLDMTGYNLNSKNKIGIVTNGVTKELTEFSRKLVTEYCKIGYEDTTLNGGTSDHAAWILAGYRACFPFEAVVNPHIHTENDLIEKLDIKNAIEWIKLGISFVIEMSQ
eukprot:gene4289-7645_t